jgi:hypothetical protein
MVDGLHVAMTTMRNNPSLEFLILLLNFEINSNQARTGRGIEGGRRRPFGGGPPAGRIRVGHGGPA